MSDSVRPHRRQPTRLPRPWDSPGKNTGVGCHFLLQCMKVERESEVAQLCPTLSNPMDCSLPGSSVRGILQARVLEWVAIAFSILLSKCCIDSFSCWTMSEPVVSQLHLLPFLKNYGQRFVTLYRRQYSKPSLRKRNAKRQNGCLRRFYK